MTEHGELNVDLYTRNGFAGPLSTMVRPTYSPGYTRVEGTYRPQRLHTWTLEAADDPRAIPVTVLDSDTVKFELWHRNLDTAFAMRDVRNDQLFFVTHGNARLETDFGVLELSPLDMVVVPRAVSYRLSQVDSLRMMVLTTVEQMNIDADMATVLDREVELPRAFDAGEIRSGEQELVVRHGAETTSYYFDYDPLAVLKTEGAPVVQRFSLEGITPPPSEGPMAAPPARLVYGASQETLVFYLGARETVRPPVHHNADYDEVGIYACGPGVFGHMTHPGTVVWVPKGLIHQGPAENVPEGYVAWLFETRANLERTPAGAEFAALMETSLFGIHPSEDTANIKQ
ncbi:homogentisate 1,2-dioxygenase [Mycobacterium sp. DBP42]|uniref:homogentisate 1,2-dioxygenase n=1 Tax=Mycobacterium sp. DBP42 TaxID=2545267 RepID=UPI00110CEBE2|nr:homogentisate 1,2-dioxygenase [Mycobacterium sp. DBP42]TMS51169.1 homogentisate 1,2-dioxygenase [Mycobacterium sp. DBP42]